MSSMDNVLVQKHERSLRLFSLIPRAVAFLLLAVSVNLPIFDASPQLVRSFASHFLRWDGFYYLHIAQHGYVYENEWAFLRGVPWVMRYISAACQYLCPMNPSTSLLLAGLFAATACDTSLTLYRLTLHHFSSPHLAFITTLLSFMPSSPATLYLTPYSEPFFTYLSYKGMLHCARTQWLTATAFFTLASLFRSNGIFLSGFIVWGRLVEPFLRKERFSLYSLAYTALLSASVISPFIYHNISATLAFCFLAEDTQRAPFCTDFPYSIYSHVQSKYWHNGLFRYWSLQQLPNFVITAPPLLILYIFSIYHLRVRLSGVFHPSNRGNRPFSASSLTPHAIHSLFICCLLLFASHTQILLRVAASLPLTYWAAAWLVIYHPAHGQRWVAWSMAWGTISVVLWSSFLPPA